MVSLMVILLSTKCFLFVYMYIDLLTLKAYLKIVMLTSPGSFFFLKPTCYITWSSAKFSSHFFRQPCITANSNLVLCFWYGSYTSHTEFTSASYLLPVLRLTLFSNITWSTAKFSSQFTGV